MAIVARGLGKGSSGRVIVTAGLGLVVAVEPPVPGPPPSIVFGAGAVIGGASITLSEWRRRMARARAQPELVGFVARPELVPAAAVDDVASSGVDAAAAARKRRRRRAEEALLLVLLAESGTLQ